MSRWRAARNAVAFRKFTVYVRGMAEFVRFRFLLDFLLLPATTRLCPAIPAYEYRPTGKSADATSAKMRPRPCAWQY